MFDDLELEQIKQLSVAEAGALLVKWGDPGADIILRQKAIPCSSMLETFSQNSAALTSVEYVVKRLMGRLHEKTNHTDATPSVQQPWMESKDSFLKDAAKLEMLRKITNAYGLAFCQVAHRARAFTAACWPLMHLPHAVNRPFVEPELFVDPEILDMSGQQTNLEKCMSIKDTVAVVTRANIIKMRYTNALGNTVVQVFDGYYTAILQHEIDHNNGDLILGKANLLLSDRQFEEYKQTKVLPKIGRNFEDYNYSM